MNLSNTWYDRLKYIQMIALPAIAAAILALNAFWDIPNQDRIVGTIVVAGTLLGALLKKTSDAYEGAGDLVVRVDETDGVAYLSADLNVDPASYKDGRNVTLNVKREDIAA